MTETEALGRRLAHHAIAAHDFAPGTIEQARLLLLDYLAIAAAGSTRDSARSAQRAFPANAADEGALVEGTGARIGAQDAALVNGISAHGLEIDDTHEQSSSHPGVAIWPALFALADTAEADDEPTLRDLLEAAIVGYDVMCSAGVLLGAAESYGRGFHPTGVAGVLGSTAAAARLLGLSLDETANALALGANTACGSLEFLSDGSWTKRLNAGAAAANGVRAVTLARAGFLGPQKWLEGRDGWLVQYGRGVPADRELELSLGAGVASTSIKLYPCCRYMHGVMDLMIDLHAELPGLEPADVAAVRVAVIEAGQALVSVPAERKLVIDTPVDAQFSMPFGAALALTTGAAPLAEFDDAPTVARGLTEWLPKIESVVDERVEAAYPASWEAAVELELADGRRFERYTSAYRGSPDEPASWDDIVTKAEGLIGPGARPLADSLRPERDDEPAAAIHRPTADTPVPELAGGARVR